MFSSSINMRISSGIAKPGWVSLMWTATLSGQLGPIGCRSALLKSLTIYCMVADVKKYCCFRRSSLALVVVILGIEDLGDDFSKIALIHGADVIAFVEVFHVDALGRAGRPQAQRARPLSTS